MRTSSDKVFQRLRGTYKRHKTFNLFAALEVAIRIGRSETTQTTHEVMVAQIRIAIVNLRN